MTEEIEKVIERVQKLKRMADSAKEVGSLEEADAFMRGMHKTLAFHNLDESVLSLDLKDKKDPLISRWVTQAKNDEVKKGSEQWAINLARAVGQAHFCHGSGTTSQNWIVFYGRKSNVDVCVKMYTYLRDMALRIGTAAYLAEEQRLHKVYGSARGAAQFKWNWFEGFSAEVSRRYKEMRERVESDSSMALVLVGVRKEAFEYAKQFFSKSRSYSSSPKTVESYDAAARRAGKEAASSVNLHPHNLDGDTITPRKLIK